MLEKRTLMKDSLVVFGVEDLKEYNDHMLDYGLDNLPAKDSMLFLEDNVGEDIAEEPDGSFIVYDFYHIRKDSVLIFSELGVSVLSRRQLNQISQP